MNNHGCRKKCHNKRIIFSGIGAVLLGTVVSAWGLNVTDNIKWRGQKSIKIETQNATYYYHKAGCGFASVFDRDGNDWVDYKDESEGLKGSQSYYRGIPNMGLNDFGHPGYTGGSSTVSKPSGDKAVIVSSKGSWKVKWEIFETHVKHTVESAAKEFWWLYEGTPGGKFSCTDDYYMVSSGKKFSGDKDWKKVDLPDPEWICFGDKKLNRVIFFSSHKDDDKKDRYFAMGCNGGMTVFGFRRSGGNYDLSELPLSFSFGFIESTDYETIKERIRATKEDAVSININKNPTYSKVRQPERNVIYPLVSKIRRDKGQQQTARYFTLRGIELSSRAVEHSHCRFPSQVVIVKTLDTVR